MPPARQKGHTTLSDLLADDVRDYFLREGVPSDNGAQQQRTPPNRRGRNRRGHGHHQHPPGIGNCGGRQAAGSNGGPALKGGNEVPASMGALRAGWATPSSSAKSSYDGGNDQSGYYQKQHDQQRRRGSCDSGQDTAERGTALRGGHGRHGSAGSIGNASASGGGGLQQQPHLAQQQHRRHGSGSGSFHSRGSASSRGRHVTAADAEFLRRYAEEKERTNMRMLAARPGYGVGSGGGVGGGGYGAANAMSVDTRLPEDPIASSLLPDQNQHQHHNLPAINLRPYHSLISSPRPPTVTGSHRPGLPSIDGDDWEEDDRLERKEARRRKKRMERQQNRSRLGSAGSGGDSPRILRMGSAGSGGGGSSPRLSRMGSADSGGGGSNSPRMRRNSRSANSVGAESAQNSVVYHNYQSHDNGGMGNGYAAPTRPAPEPINGRATSHGSSTMGSGSGSHLTPGSERYESGSSTLCYSTGSSHQHHHGFPQHGAPPEMPRYGGANRGGSGGYQHSRGDSMGSFIRRASAASGGDEGGDAKRYPQQREAKANGGGGRHVRPLSYLSASSDSGRGEADDDDEDLGGERGDGVSSFQTPLKEGAAMSDSSPSTLFGLKASPISTSSGNTGNNFGSGASGGRQHPLAMPRFNSSSADASAASLFGSAILDSGGESTRGGRGDQSDYHYQQQQQRGRFGGHDYSVRRPRGDRDESTDASYDSSSGSSESTSSDSYYGDSSSDESRASSDRDLRGGGGGGGGGVRWEPVNFHRDDVEGGWDGGERDRLFRDRNGGAMTPNYSSVDASLTRKASLPRSKRKHRYGRSSGSSSSTSRNRRAGGGLGGGNGLPLRLDEAIDVLSKKLNSLLVTMELFISNMPSLVGSLALAWCSLGVDWFKWYEETFDACHPTHYHNKACVYTEFPGCFACDTEKDGYQFFVHFHYLCSTMSFILSSFLIGKIMIAFPVVRDELANPTTAAPLGLLCMSLEKIFAGNFGSIGKCITYLASGLHTIVAGWFIFISVVYKTLPEPSWFANTTGIGLAAAKLYLYWTDGGYFLSGFSLLAFALFYVIALIRIHTNEKISVPVCWVQLSGPAVVLYGFTIFSQPGSDEDDYALLIEENRDHFYRIHRKYYMPVLNVLFAFCMISMASSLYLLRTRWKSFRDKEFSPAHVSFCAPLVSHTNAMQAYRSSLQKFSLSPPGTPFKLLLYRYWVLSLICGTVLVLVMTWKFFVYLPRWCQIDVEDDEMPPEPEETMVTQLLQRGDAGDAMRQNFVSAAVLQANESGALVRVLQDGRMKYVRSRRMPSMGFDPIMNVSELMSERERLLQHVTYAAQPSRDRGGMNSFDDTLMDTFNEPSRLRASSGRHRLNFLSFDASAMMRGDH